MNSDIEQLVRDGLDRLTAEETGAGHILVRARRQHRRRTSALRFVAAGGGAAVAAAAVVIASSMVGSPAASGRSQTHFTAYVTSRAEQVLAASGERDVVHATVVSELNGVLVRLSGWSDGRASKTAISTGSAAPRYAAGYIVRKGNVTVAIIDYRNQTWRQLTLPGGRSAHTPLPAAVMAPQTVFRLQLVLMRSRCAGAGRPGQRFGEFSWPMYIRRMLSCGGFEVRGHGTVDGEAAIKLVAAHFRLLPRTVTATLWVSKASHLPLRLIFGPVSAGGYRVDLRWLPATRSNLAKASILPAPSGFRRLPWRG